MSKLNQKLITIGGALFLFILFSVPLTKLDIMIFGRSSGGGFGDIGPEIPEWVDAFSYAFLFFLTLIEFFFKKSFLDRRPYLYIVGFFVLLSFFDNQLLLVTIGMIIISVSPGTLYNWIKDKKATPSR